MNPVEQPTEPNRTNIDELTQQTNDDVPVTRKTQKKQKYYTQKQTNDHKKPQKTPLQEKHKKTRRVHLNDAKGNFCSHPNPNYSNFYKLKINADTNKTSLTFLASF